MDKHNAEDENSKKRRILTCRDERIQKLIENHGGEIDGDVLESLKENRGRLSDEDYSIAKNFIESLDNYIKDNQGHFDKLKEYYFQLEKLILGDNYLKKFDDKLFRPNRTIFNICKGQLNEIITTKTQVPTKEDDIAQQNFNELVINKCANSEREIHELREKVDILIEEKRKFKQLRKYFYDGEIKLLKTWLKNSTSNPNFNSDFDLSLLYQATEHGFGASNFHNRVDKINNIIVFIITETSGTKRRFGAFTPCEFSSSNGWVQESLRKIDDQLDTAGFIFSFDGNVIFKLKKEVRDRALSDFSNKGPCFGSGPDLYISDNSNINYSSESNLGNSYNISGVSYKDPDPNNDLMIPLDSERAKSYLAGSEKFKVKEMFVFKVEGLNIY